MKKTLNILLLLSLFLLSPSTVLTQEQDGFVRLRYQMVSRQIVARGVKDAGVIEAMKKVPRHLFVPEKYRSLSYGDHPLPIGKEQTISQPYIVAFMTEALALRPEDRVLEIGTGSGYQAAILAELVDEVYTIEIIESLGRRAQKTLGVLGYKNIHVKIGDGYKGWPDQAPFDAVIVTCAPENIPQSLIRQLKDGGRMIIPVGSEGTIQNLVKAIKEKGRLKTKSMMPVRFVPMVRDKPIGTFFK